jgi:hypothetical protein
MAATTLDEELVEGIRGAKKKARNFAIIAKGPAPVKLIVQKKPLRDGDINKAKTEFKGNDVIRGVVAGEGAELVFYVLGEEPTLKTTKLKEFIAEQTELTVKPRFAVVNELPVVSESDDDEVQAQSQASPQPESIAPPPPPPPVPPPPPPPALDAKTLLAALNKLSPQIQAAAQAHPNRKQDLLALVAGIKQQVGNQQTIGEAKGTLSQIMQLLKELGSGQAAPAPTKAPPGPAAGSLVAFQKSRLDWDSTRKAVQAELQKLEQSILAASKAEPDADEIAAGTKNLYTMLDTLDTRLIDKLDDALNAEKPEQRAKLQDEAYDIVAEYRDFVDSDPLLQEIDQKNGFTQVAIKSRLVATLDDLGSRLVS